MSFKINGAMPAAWGGDNDKSISQQSGKTDFDFLKAVKKLNKTDFDKLAQNGKKEGDVEKFLKEHPQKLPAAGYTPDIPDKTNDTIKADYPDNTHDNMPVPSSEIDTDATLKKWIEEHAVSINDALNKAGIKSDNDIKDLMTFIKEHTKITGLGNMKKDDLISPESDMGKKIAQRRAFIDNTPVAISGHCPEDDYVPVYEEIDFGIGERRIIGYRPKTDLEKQGIELY